MKKRKIGLATHIGGVILWFNEWHCRYDGRLFGVEEIVRPDTGDWFATTEDIRNSSKYMVKLKRARL
jgi:hypothetical protein